jgi:hypothetical protein
MIKRNYTPMSNTITVSVPDSYIGKPVELLLYTPSESEDPEESVVPKRPHYTDWSRFEGTMSSETADRFHEYIRRCRSE